MASECTSLFVAEFTRQGFTNRCTGIVAFCLREFYDNCKLFRKESGLSRGRGAVESIEAAHSIP